MNKKLNNLLTKAGITVDEIGMLSQFKGRKTSKILRDGEKSRNTPEWDEQLKFCKWLKNDHPDILFRSDMQAGTKKSYGMQNIMQIIDPYSGWPDVTIYSLHLMIEMKAPGASLSGEHWDNQQRMHERLRGMGWTVEVAFGFEEAKEIFLGYLPKPIKKSRCCGRCDGVHDICVADMVCDDHEIMGCEICFGER